MVHAHTLHVTNGTSVTGTFDPVMVPGDYMVWCDPLHDGPVPGDVSEAELRRVRASFLAGTNAKTDDVAAILQELETADRQLAAAADYDEVILWFEHDLFDQLNLIHLLDRLAAPSARPRVSLICIDRHPNHPTFKGLGELSAPELTALLPARTAVTDDQYASASSAWRAFRSSDPRDIERWLESDRGVLPFLAAALRRHLEEFPWTTTGLSRREGRALALIGEGHATTWELFRRFDDDDRAFYMTDLGLIDLLRRLAEATPPLVAITEGPPAPDGWPNARVTLTSAARAPRRDSTGIEKWLGGVHITGQGPTWRWDPNEKRLIHP